MANNIYLPLLACALIFIGACGVSRASWESQTDIYENGKKTLKKTPERPADILIQP